KKHNAKGYSYQGSARGRARPEHQVSLVFRACQAAYITICLHGDMEETAEVFRVLGDESRLRILRLLLEEPLNVGELTSILGLAQPTVSKHLGELKKNHL